MNKREAGKQRAEQFVTEVAQRVKPEAVSSLLWWPADPPKSGVASGADDPMVRLRIYSGRSWRSIGFAGSDLDGSVEDPAALKKYESEIAESLAEL